ncbi:transglutaminaseTgpA domain-containing protein [Cohnella sp. CFH 77786]|uniref:transglutaminase TgpA family protein n=1 Tax=Cohnella sp. CFH 77786 TaxID=2662265 RepID=UPI001C60B5EC
MNRGSSGVRPGVRWGSGFWGQLVLDRVHRLFVIVILLQLFQCFRDYWWEETYSVLYGVLAVTAVCELAFTRWYGVRLALETAAAIVLAAAYSPFYQWIGWPDNWKQAAQWNLFYESHIASLHPFFELAVGAVLTVHFLSRIGRNRSLMLTVLMTSIGVMATVDSFFPLELWHNIAWIVSAGLGWLVILHLRELRARHPDSWEALAERPIDLALPAVAVISLLLLSGVFMPRAPALLEDPYTIWSEAQGREVPSLAGEGGVLGSSSGSSVKSGSASSGYGRDDRNIGGGFDFDYSPVMTVQTNRRSYWRGETKAVYTGKGWGDLRQPVSFPLGNGGATNFFIPGRSENAKTEKITQTVTILRKDRLPVLFAAGPATRVGDLESDANGSLILNPEEWELKFRRPARVQTYTVESEVTMLDRRALRGVAVPAQGAASIDLSPYLQLPDSLPSRVKELAAKVTAAGTNPFDKAELLEGYLKKTYPYNNKPDLSKRKSADVTDAFLFEIREGYCDYYSTAFVVMARSLGIPARWVKGYASGVDPAKTESLRFGGVPDDPDGPGTYTVRNADAHSWAEVYFEGYGWIPFEPTAGFSVPLPVPADAPLELETDPAASKAPEAAADEPESIGWGLPAAGAGVVLAAAAAFFLARKRKGHLLWNRIRYAGASPDQRIIRDMERLLKFLKRRGLKREAHETMRESFRRWGDKFSSLRTDFDGILVRFERARYGKDDGGETDAREFAAAVAKLRKAL